VFLVYGIWYSQRTPLFLTAGGFSSEGLNSWSSEPKPSTVTVSHYPIIIRNDVR